MKSVIKNYKDSIILVIFILLGTILGIVLKEKATIFSPFGDLFINMLLITIIPLLFLTITSSIYKVNKPKRLGKTLFSIIITFIFTSLIMIFIGIICTKLFKLVNVKDIHSIINSIDTNFEYVKDNTTILERIVNMVSVSDFSKLLTRDNMIALIIVSVLVGISMLMAKEEAQPLYNLLESAKKVLFSFIKIIMYYAPIGLCCYFASLVGTFGSSIVLGYLKTFIIYTIATLVIYFVIYPLFAYISYGKEGVKRFWHNIIPPSLTALATCSSAASIPVNMTSTKKIGVNEDIADITISLGTSFHKDGSSLGSVFKIMFLVYLFNSDISIIKIIAISLLATLLVSAIPIGGGTISETLIITLLGFPIATLPILTIIATIIDPGATLLNVVGDTSAAMLINKIVNGKKERLT